MVFEIILTVVMVIQVYVIINLLVKTEKLETWVENFTQQVTKVQDDLKEIDQSGAFESDDEVGTIFEQIKLTVNGLEQFRGEEVEKEIQDQIERNDKLGLKNQEQSDFAHVKKW